MKNIIKKIEYYFYNFFIIKFVVFIQFILFLKRQKILYFGVPTHSNMGDQAQCICIYEWLKKFYPKHKIISFPTRIITNDNGLFLKKISKFIKNNDLIFFQSGYTITDLYSENEIMHNIVINLFNNNKIIFFPQTIYFTSTEKGNMALKNCKHAIEKHGKIILLCRDRISYEFAMKNFNNCKIHLFPDIVTTKIGLIKSENKTNKITVCLRNDKEKYYKKEEINVFLKELLKYGEYNLIDTSIDINGYKISRNRNKYFKKMLEIFKKNKLTITDRYHGIIFSLITNTPVIVLKTNDHKIVAGLEWYKDICSNNIYYVDDLNEIFNIISYIKNNDSIKTDYYKDFYNNLPKLINE